MKIVFLLSSSNHARFIKRITIIRSLGVTTKTLYFNRENSYPGKDIPGEKICLGKVKHRNYLSRLLDMFKNIKAISKEINDCDVVYTFAFDMLFVCYIAKFFSKNKQKIVYEVGDIREIFLKKSVVSKIARLLEKSIAKKIDLLVVTSKAYESEYFKNILGLKNKPSFITIENKLYDDEIVKYVGKKNITIKKNQEYLTIGYFGVLRCYRTWEIIKRISDLSEGKIKFYLRGVTGLSTSIINEEHKKYYNVIFDGSYVSPDDLYDIYSKVDLVWGCYPYQKLKPGNWQWARTIRFYEACYFKRPIIAQKGTEDSKVVESLSIGTSVDLSDVEKATNSVLAISFDDVIRWHNNMLEIPRNTYLYINEHKELVDKLRG